MQDETIQFGNAPHIVWAEIDRWSSDGTPPNHLLLTLFTLQSYSIWFCAIKIFHFFVVMITKWRICAAFSELNFLEKIKHILVNCQISRRVNEWDCYNQMEEIGAIILVNFIFKWLSMIPLGILGKYLRTDADVVI